MVDFPLVRRIGTTEVRARHQRLMFPPNGRRSDEREVISHVKFVRQRYRQPWQTPVLEVLSEPLVDADREALLRPPPVLPAATVDLAAVELTDLPAIPLALIVEETARYFGVPRLELVSERQDRRSALMRHIGMYLCRVLTGRSLPVIGRAFGRRDHTTVMHACHKVERLVLEREGVAEAIDLVGRAVLRTHIQRHAGWA